MTIAPSENTPEGRNIGTVENRVVKVILVFLAKVINKRSKKVMIR